MKLSAEQIKKTDARLISEGFHFMDIRFEVLDHLICLLEEKETDFENGLEEVFVKERVYLQQQRKSYLNRMAGARIHMMKDLFWNPVFIILWLASFVVYCMLPYTSIGDLLKDLDVLPVALPLVAFVLHGLYFFRSTNKVTGTFAALFSVSFLLQVYLICIIPLVRKLENMWSVGILSLFTAVALMMYYLFFKYKHKNEVRYRDLLN